MVEKRNDTPIMMIASNGAAMPVTHRELPNKIMENTNSCCPMPASILPNTPHQRPRTDFRRALAKLLLSSS